MIGEEETRQERKLRNNTRDVYINMRSCAPSRWLKVRGFGRWAGDWDAGTLNARFSTESYIIGWVYVRLTAPVMPVFPNLDDSTNATMTAQSDSLLRG